MAFTDIIFIFTFLPVALLVYHIARESFKPVILLVFSLLFYACGTVQYFGLLVFSLAINVAFGYLIEKSRSRKSAALLLLSAGIIFDLVILGYFKYFDFALATVNRMFHTALTARNLLLPLGLSFYTFKAISYLVDIYKGKAKGTHFLTAALYLSFFGQIQSGPIARYETFDIPGGGYLGFASKGTVRFMAGFIKKILLSDVLGNIVTEVFDQTTQLSTSLAWLGAICYSLQLYYDFSGYSDMAFGICAMFGYDCPENFNYPYTTKSVSEFWRRWHITLGGWFRDYIYIPLGGSREGKLRLYRNLFIVWFLTGLWHGAGWNFIAWGLVYFVWIAFEKSLGLPEKLNNKILKNLYRIIVLFFINFQWVLFRSNGFRWGISFIHTMIVPQGSGIADSRARFLLEDYSVFLVTAILFVMPLIPALKKFCSRTRGMEIAFHVVFCVGISGLFVLALSMVVSGQNNPFLYASF